MMRYPALKRLICGVLFLWCGLLSLTCEAQDKDRERRRQVTNGILNLLIESQGGPPQSFGPRPGQPLPPPRPTGEATREMLRARESLEQMRAEASVLNNALQKEATTNPHVRGILGETLKFQARADAVAQHARHTDDHRALIQEVSLLDREWRLLSVRVQQLPKLPKHCQDSIGRLNGFHSSLCQHLSIDPSIDRRGLVREAESLSAHMRALVDDISFETRGAPNSRDLMIDAGRAQQAAFAFSEIASSDAPFRIVIDRYESFSRAWGPLASRLTAVKSRYIERDLLQIQQDDQKLRELLWLPRRLNRELIIQLASSISAEVDHVLDDVPLRLLIALPTRDQVPDAAYDLAGYCEHFEECVRRSDNITELVDAYDDLPVVWIAFVRHFRSVESPLLKQHFGQIEQRIVALREPLGIRGGFDRDEARQRAAAIEHLAEHLDDDINTWLTGKSGFDAERRALMDRASAVRVSARQLHVATVQSAPPEAIEKLVDALHADWEDLQRRIVSSKAPDREHLLNVLLRIGSELVEVETLLL